MAKWVRLRLTERQHEQLNARAKADRRTMTDTVELCLIGVGYIGAPSAEASNGQARGANGSSTQTEAEKQRIARDAKWEARQVREKGRALEDGYAWNEVGGYATDSKGKRIALRDDDDWEYVEI